MSDVVFLPEYIEVGCVCRLTDYSQVLAGDSGLKQGNRRVPHGRREWTVGYGPEKAAEVEGLFEVYGMAGVFLFVPPLKRHKVVENEELILSNVAVLGSGSIVMRVSPPPRYFFEPQGPTDGAHGYVMRAPPAVFQVFFPAIGPPLTFQCQLTQTIAAKDPDGNVIRVAKRIIGFPFFDTIHVYVNGEEVFDWTLLTAGIIEFGYPAMAIAEGIPAATADFMFATPVRITSEMFECQLVDSSEEAPEDEQAEEEDPENPRIIEKVTAITVTEEFLRYDIPFTD